MARTVLQTVELQGGEKILARIDPTRTRCRKGHALSPANVVWRKDTGRGLCYRDCRKCRRISASKMYHDNPVEHARRVRQTKMMNIKRRETRGSIMNMFQDIKDFHVKFELEYKGPPRQLPSDLDGFRTKFAAEELAEYISNDKLDQNIICDAILDVLQGVAQFGGQPGLEKKLDALVDLVYVALGTAYLHGFNFEEAWKQVHAANMKKVRAAKDGSDSARKSSHDVVKPPGWTPPDLSDLVDPNHVAPKKPWGDFDEECIPGN